jgi:hypothetical protein
LGWCQVFTDPLVENRDVPLQYLAQDEPDLGVQYIRLSRIVAGTLRWLDMDLRIAGFSGAGAVVLEPCHQEIPGLDNVLRHGTPRLHRVTVRQGIEDGLMVADIALHTV